jgi:hypothetical protein
MAMKFRLLPLATVSATLASCGVALAGLEVISLGKNFTPDPARVLIQQTHATQAGNTSVRNEPRERLVWKTAGYYERNRDLGQLFTAEKDFLLEAIVLRTGPADRAVLAGAPGAHLFIQFFEVMGTPRINDNGTPPGTAARHGFTPNHRADDVIEGVRYRSIGLATGGQFPKLPPTRDARGQPTGDDTGKLVYLRWKLTGDSAIRFAAGRRYAFMVGFEEPGRERCFTLANANAAAVNAPSSLTDAHDPYHGGWGIRREGDGTLPPTQQPGEQPPADAAGIARLQEESLFATGSARFALTPTTDGFPDVDTYRDFEFYLEGREIKP